MLNKELLTDKDIEIYRLHREIKELKSKIEEFKEFDEERTTKVNEIIGKYNELAKVHEEGGVNKLLEQNRSLRNQLAIAIKKLAILDNFELVDSLDEDTVKLQSRVIGQKITIKNLTERCKILKRNYYEVLYKLNSAKINQN